MQTLVIPALPFFQREFDTTPTGATWIATGFLLSSCVLTPILGKLGDSYGKSARAGVLADDLRPRVARPPRSRGACPR